MPRKPELDVPKNKIITMRVTEQLNHFLETRVLEMRAVAENKKGIDKSWLILRLMELGQDWLATHHLGQPTDYEEWLGKEIGKYEKRKRLSEHEKGYFEGLQWALKKFEEYEDLVCNVEKSHDL